MQKVYFLINVCFISCYCGTSHHYKEMFHYFSYIWAQTGSPQRTLWTGWFSRRCNFQYRGTKSQGFLSVKRQARFRQYAYRFSAAKTEVLGLANKDIKGYQRFIIYYLRAYNCGIISIQLVGYNILWVWLLCHLDFKHFTISANRYDSNGNWGEGMRLLQELSEYWGMLYDGLCMLCRRLLFFRESCHGRAGGA